MPKFKRSRKVPAAKPAYHIERKTAATGAGALVPAAGLASVVGSTGGVLDYSWAPPWAQSVIAFVIAWVIPTYLAWRASHTTRPDLAPAVWDGDPEEGL